MNYSSIPISLSGLNKGLENCESPEQLRETFGFLKNEKDGKQLTLKIFLDSISYLVESYTDLNFTNWGIFTKRIDLLFSHQREKDRQAFQNLQDLVKERFRVLYPHLNTQKFIKNDPSGFMLNSIIQDDSGKQEKATLSSEWIFDFYAKKFELSAESRLNDARNIAQPVNAKENAKFLQIVLNLLILETDLIKHVSDYVDISLKVCQIQKIYREGCDRILRLTPFTEITLFEIPANIEDTNEFAFWVNLAPYIDLSLDNERLYAHLKLLTEDEINYSKLKEHFQHLKKTTPNEKIQLLIDKWLVDLDFHCLTKKLSKKTKSLTKFIFSIQQTLIFKEEFSDTLESTVAPISYFLLNTVRKHIMKILEEIPRDFPETELKEFSEAVSLWEKNKHKQRELFLKTQNQLSDLISKIQNKKKKIEFYQFTKDLTGSINAKQGPMRSYPNRQELSTLIVNNSQKSAEADSNRIQPPLSKNQSSEQAIKPSKRKKKEKSLPPTPSTKNGTQALPEDSFPYQFDNRVKRWDFHPFGTPLTAQAFPEYCQMDLRHQKLMHIFHSPHKLVDQFSSLGIQGTWCNTKRNQDDLRYIIPAEITFEGKSHRGLITYAIDRNTNICYHRFFTEKKDRDLVYQIINKTFDENDFPELKDVVNSPPPSKPKYLAEYKCTVAIDDRTGNVEIQDHDRGVLIKLFKTS